MSLKITDHKRSKDCFFFFFLHSYREKTTVVNSACYLSSTEKWDPHIGDFKDYEQFERRKKNIHSPGQKKNKSPFVRYCSRGSDYIHFFPQGISPKHSLVSNKTHTVHEYFRSGHFRNYIHYFVDALFCLFLNTFTLSHVSSTNFTFGSSLYVEKVIPSGICLKPRGFCRM